MNPSTEISPSIQLLLAEMRKLFDEHAAKWDRRFAEMDAARDQRMLSRGDCVPISAAAIGVDVAADNWGGLFDRDDATDGADLLAPVATSTAFFVAPADATLADNWGGLFEHPARVVEERVPDFSDLDTAPAPSSTSASLTPVPSAATPVSQRICEFYEPEFAQEAEHSRALVARDEQERRAAIVHAEHLLTNTPPLFSDQAPTMERIHRDPDIIAPTTSTTDSVPVLRASVGNSPAAFQRQIHEFVQPIEKKPVAQQEAERSGFPVRSEWERHVAFAHAKLLAASGRVFIGVNLEFCGFRLVLDKYVQLHDDPESGFTHHGAPLLQTIGRIGQAFAAAAELRVDAVGAAGGGLACVLAAGSAQATCSTVCLAGDRSIADIPVGALRKEKLQLYDSLRSANIPVMASTSFPATLGSSLLYDLGHFLTIECVEDLYLHMLCPPSLPAELIFWPLPMLSVEQQPWPPPVKFGFLIVGPQPHLLGFNQDDEMSMSPCPQPCSTEIWVLSFLTRRSVIKCLFSWECYPYVIEFMDCSTLLLVCYTTCLVFDCQKRKGEVQLEFLQHWARLQLANRVVQLSCSVAAPIACESIIFVGGLLRCLAILSDMLSSLFMCQSSALKYLFLLKSCDIGHCQFPLEQYQGDRNGSCGHELPSRIAAVFDQQINVVLLRDYERVMMQESAINLLLGVPAMQPWPPPVILYFTNAGAVLWPMQWPSFYCSGVANQSKSIFTGKRLSCLELQFYHLLVEDP